MIYPDNVQNGRKDLTKYLQLFMTREFLTIRDEWRGAVTRPQRVHGDSKSQLPKEDMYTSHILHLRQSGGAQKATSFVRGDFYHVDKVAWQIPLPEVDAKDVEDDGKLAEIIKNTVISAWKVRFCITC